MPSLHSNSQLSPLRRFSAELLACAVLNLFPKVLLVGGSETTIGFFYDFIFHQPIDAHVLELIEVKMRALAKEAKKVRMLSMMRENAHGFFMHHQQPILAERALEEEQNIISLIQIDDFYGLCPELSIESAEEVKCFRLLGIKAVEGGEVTRIEGTAFLEAFFLKQFLKAYERLKKSDHRLLGPELGLFNFEGVEPCWYPRGRQLCEILEGVWRKQCQEQEVQFVSTPLVIKTASPNKDFSFQWQHHDWALSHSKFDQHIELFKSLRGKMGASPLRLGELTTIYEAVDEAHQWGLFRSCSYRTDLVTIFCSREQVAQELIYSLQFIQQTVRIFGFEAHWYLVGGVELKSSHSQAIEWLKQALQGSEICYSFEHYEERIPPRLEVRLVDLLGREWTAGKVEVRLPPKTDPSMPVILARSVFGSLDRLIALLTEQDKGEFPLWLTPEQIRILTVGEAAQAYAESVYQACRQQGFRVQIDNRHERQLSAKVHEAEKEKVPYLLIIGSQEVLSKRVTVRTFQERHRTRLLTLDECLDRIKQDYVDQASQVGLNY